MKKIIIKIWVNRKPKEMYLNVSNYFTINEEGSTNEVKYRNENGAYGAKTMRYFIGEFNHE